VKGRALKIYASLRATTDVVRLQAGDL